MSTLLASWSNERVETLKRLWADGVSCSEIAAELGGGLTRNAVIGKVHRLGLSGRTRAQPKRPSQPRVRTRHARPARPAALQSAPVVERVEDHAIPAAQRRSLIELTACTCRWPVGDPSTPEFFFCGAPANESSPYCPGHAFAAASVRRAAIPSFR
jgi:GcrA cell cycle regulator